MAEHRGPLTADLHRYHGVRLAQVRQAGYSITELADFAANLPLDSAVSRAVDPDWALTSDTFLLREIEYDLRVLVWQQTEDGSRKTPRNHPNQIPLTRAEIEANKPKHEYDVMTIDEANDFLGWSA